VAQQDGRTRANHERIPDIVLKGVMQTTLCCDSAGKMLTRYRQENYNFVMLPGWRWTRSLSPGKGDTAFESGTIDG
jgi:hypothetical protein